MFEIIAKFNALFSYLAITVTSLLLRKYCCPPFIPIILTNAGFSIEGGTRRLIAAYFVCKSLFFALF